MASGAGALSPQRVPLDAKRIDGESVATTRVVESVDHDLDRVIGKDVLAAVHASADLLRLAVPADKSGIQILLVVSEVYVSVLRGLCAVRRLARNKAGDS